MTNFPPPDEATAILLLVACIILAVIAVGVWRRKPPEDHRIDRIVEQWCQSTNTPIAALPHMLTELRLANELLLLVAEYAERFPAPQPALSDATATVPDGNDHAEEEARVRADLIAANNRMIEAIEVATRPLPTTFSGEARKGAEAVQAILKSALAGK